MSLANTSLLGGQQQNQPTITSSQQSHSGSTALNYSNSNVSNQSLTHSSNSRKSLISNPINFQHLQHMGPNDGKSFMTTDIPIISSSSMSTSSSTGAAAALPPLSSGSRLLNISALSNSPGSEKSILNTTKKSTSSSAIRQIAKKEISAPTNFRHVIRGLEDFSLITENRRRRRSNI
jgi:hypothetical protein